MTTKANKIRAAARKRVAENSKNKLLEQADHDNRETLLAAESKAMLEEMRSQGFCAPRGVPTVKQYSRYAAFKNSQAATSRAQIVADDAAVISAHGGIAAMILKRLAIPNLKDTAAAQLLALLQRSVVMAPSLVDETQRVSLATDSNIVEDDELSKVAKEFGVDL